MSDGLKLLGAIVDTGSVNVLRELRGDYFLDNEKAVYNYMRLHYRRYGSVPTIETLEEEIGVAIPVADENISYYQKRVEDRYLYGVIKSDYTRLKESLRVYNMDEARQVIDDMRRTVRVHSSESNVLSIHEAALRVLELYEYSHDNPGVSGVPSGLPGLDASTGGYQGGDLVTYVARPALGKTYILLAQVRASWGAGYSVLVVSMEMTIPQITRRLVAMHSGINPDYIRKGQLSTHARRRLQSCVDSLAGSDRFHLYSGGRRKRPSDVEMLVQEYRPDIVYVDGAHLMNPEDSRQSQRNDRVSSIFDSLNQMTIDHDIPVVVTTHLNRSSGTKGKAASLETVAYSDAIGTHSSLVLSVGEGAPPYRNTQRILRFLKGREGEGGVIHTNFLFRPMNFTQCERLDVREQGGEEQSPMGVSTDWMLG